MTITGSNLFGFGNNILNVSFGGLLAVIDGQTTPTNSSIRVRVQSNNNAVPQQVPIIILSDKLAIVQSNFYWTYQVEGSIQNTTPSAQGQQGTKITILGTNLLGGGTSAQQVYLDGANATVVSANSTAVMVLVGSLNFQNASLYPRQIYIESNTGAIVSGGVFTLQVPGTITSISPAQGRYGTFVTLRGSNLIGYGNSIASVTIAGVSATAIQYNSSWALLRAGPSTVEVNGSVVITADTGATVSSNSSFTYQPAGMINSVVPSNVTAYTSFVILGTNLFNPGAPIYNVTIGGSPATVTFNSPTAIIGTTGPAPSNVSDMSLVINSVDGSFVTATSLFTYLSLNISLIGTTSGQEGTMITIRIPSPLDPATCMVTLGGIAASTVRFNASAKTVTVAAPRAARPGIYFADVAVQGGGLSVLLPGGFMYLQEGVINTVQPPVGQSGTVIILQGTNLLGGGTTIRSATLSSVEVTNSAVTVGSNSNNTFVQLQLSNNPSNSGVVDITLIADTGAIVRRLNAFTYVQPGCILAVSPSSGQNGTVVTINGLGLLQGSAFNAINVTLAGVSALISLQNDSQITVQANASAINTTGPVVITLSSGATISTANMTFQYLPQGVVQQVVPLRGTVGTIINITGTNLLGGGSSASVLLVGLMTQVINASMTLVTAVIQAGPNGTYQSRTLQITADTKAFLLTTQFPWTFYPLGIISSVSPASWQQGTLVTITGTSLIGTANAVARCVLAGVDASIVQMSNSTVVCRANANPSSGISNATNSSLVGPVQLYLDTGPTIVSSLNYSYYVGYISGINVTSGNSGTYVWISGAGFLPSGTTISNIFFGSVPVLSNFTIISNNLIIARVGYFNSFASASSNITSMNNITSTNATSNNTTFTNGTATNITSTNNNSTNATSANTTTPANIPTFPTGINITFTSGAYLTLPNVWTYTPPGQVLGISSSVGVPGDTITITGQNLVPANTTSVQVMLGQFPAYSAQVVNTSMITFRVGLYQTQLNTDIGQLLLQPLPIQIVASNGATVVSTNTTFAFNQTGRIDSVSPMAGGNGSTVVITGAYLLGGNGVTSVTLAGINATVISASESTIVVVAGQSPNKSEGVVVESGGQRLTGVVGNVWTYLPPLTASQVNPLSGQNGTTVNITLSSIPPQYTVQRVYLAGVQAAIQNISTPSQVIVRAGRPSQSVSGDVVIQFNGNASLTLYGAWTYSPPVVIFSLQTPVKYYNLSIPAGYYNTSGSYNASGTNGTQGTNSTVGTLGYYDSPIPVGYNNTFLNISGSGFQGGPGVTVVSVTLAGIRTDILSQSDTSLSLVISQFVNSTARNITGPIVIVSSQDATYNSSVLFTYLQVQALASSVTPNSGQMGTVVNITGSGLLAGGTGIAQFLLAGYAANVTSMSDQQITIVASNPPNQTNTSDIMYRVNTGAIVTIPRAWWYQTPGVIQQVSPLTGSYGTTITITGTGLLGGGTSVYSVSLASIPIAAVRYSSDSFVQVVAGDGPVGKSGSISIVSNTGSTVVSSIPFYYNPRGNVVSINPSSGQYGTTVTIMGTSLYQGTLGGVTLAGVSATILPGYSPSLIIVTASRPPASRSYRGDVIIVSTDGTTTNSSNAMPAQQFNYTQEGTITLVSPNKGQYGTRVAISGLGLLGGGSNLTSVLLGGVPAYVTSVSDTLVTVNVINLSLPPSTGDVVLISNTGATVVMVNGWTYVPPGNVTSLSPLMGQYGTYLNITGVYLMAGGNTTSQVLIGNVPATILSYNDTLVRVRAGSLLAPGQVFNSTVTLISIDGGIVNSTQVWSYIPGANITSIFPPYGLPGQNVTIVGSQFLGGGSAITQVTVVGINATNIQSSNTQVNFSVGPNGDGQSKSGSIVLISDTGAITTVPYAWSYNRTCLPGTFLNGSNNCAACHVECSECTGPSITQCLDCKNYKLPLSNGAIMCVSKCPSLATYGNLCVDTCASYQYMGTSSIRNASFCFNCSSTCSIYLGCTGPYSYQCMTCSVTSYKTADGMCAPCDTHCNLETGCRGPAASDCYECRNSSFLFNRACVDNCPSTTYLLDDATCDNCSRLCGVRQCYGPLPEDCVPCPTKMYPDGSGICQPCNELCSASGCYGPSSSNCYNCTDGVLSYNGECKSNGCPTNTYVSGGFCLPCHAACGSNGCKGPYVTDCNPNTDPFQAGSGTVGITVVIILVLALVLAVLLIVMVFFTTARKKQRYEVGGLEMENVSYKDKETPPGDIILEGKPGTAGIQQESAMDTADTNSVPNLDGELYTGLGLDEEDVVPEKQTDMSLDITLPKASKPVMDTPVMHAEPEEVLGPDGELYTDMHSAELNVAEVLKASEVKNGQDFEMAAITSNRPYNPYVTNQLVTSKISAAEAAATADVGVVPLRPPKSQAQSKPAEPLSDNRKSAVETSKAAVVPLVEKRKSVETPKATAEPLADKRKSAEITAPPVETTTDRRKSTEIKKPLEQRKSMISIPEDKPVETVKPPERPSDKRKPSASLPKDKPPPPLPADEEPILPAVPELELYTDMEIKSEPQEVYIDPQQGQEEYTDMATASKSIEQEQYEETAPFQSPQERPTTSAKTEEVPSQQSPPEDVSHMPAEDMYEDTDVAVELAQEYIKKQDSTASMQRNSLQLQPNVEKVPELPSRTATDNAAPALPSRPSSSLLPPKATDKGPVLPSRPSDAPALPPARPRKSIDTPLPSAPAKPSPQPTTPPPTQPEETYESAAPHEEEECLYEPIPGASRTEESDSPPPVVKPQPASRKASTDKDVKASKPKKK